MQDIRAYRSAHN